MQLVAWPKQARNSFEKSRKVIDSEENLLTIEYINSHHGSNAADSSRRENVSDFAARCG